MQKISWFNFGRHNSARIKAVLTRITKIRVYQKIMCRPEPGPGEFRKKFAGPGFRAADEGSNLF